MGFDYKERLAKHESQQGTVAPRLPPAPPSAATSSTDFRAQPPSHPLSPAGAPGHFQPSAVPERNSLAPFLPC